MTLTSRDVLQNPDFPWDFICLSRNEFNKS